MPSEWLNQSCNYYDRHCFLRATGSLNINLSEILQLGELWGSNTMTEVYNNLVEPTEDANSGIIIGNRNFYTNDYMVSSSIEIGDPHSYGIFRFSAVKATSPHLKCILRGR
jgi:hypothetical protein